MLYLLDQIALERAPSLGRLGALQGADIPDIESIRPYSNRKQEGLQLLALLGRPGEVRIGPPTTIHTAAGLKSAGLAAIDPLPTIDGLPLKLFATVVTSPRFGHSSTS